MLKGLVKHRPSHLLAVYIEDRQVEVLRASRKWRTWQIDASESFPVPEGESVFDFLPRVNLKPRRHSGAALMLLLPRTYYSCHREHYPESLGEHLDETLTFDWQDNLFHEHDKSLYFAGPAARVNGSLSVPIFSLQRSFYEKLHQILNAGVFQNFIVIPSALAFRCFVPDVALENGSSPIQMIGRVLDQSQLEINRFYSGRLLDSIVIDRRQDNLRLFRENLRCIGPAECQDEVHVEMISEGANDDVLIHEWEEENLPLRNHSLPDSLLSNWVKYFLEQEDVQNFEAPLHLKPWEVPKAIWGVLAAAIVFALFSAYEVYTVHTLQEKALNMKRQLTQLEMQWKPIEELQTKISKIQDDQKTLTQFNSEGYPLVEILTILTQTTQDDTWLNYLALRSGQLTIRGESKSAIKYLSELSKVEGLTDVKFSSPVTRNPTGDEERFNVQVQLDMEKLKKTLTALPAEEPAEDQAAVEPGGDESSGEETQASPPAKREISRPPAPDTQAPRPAGVQGHFPRGRRR